MQKPDSGTQPPATTTPATVAIEWPPVGHEETARAIDLVLTPARKLSRCQRARRRELIAALHDDRSPLSQSQIAACWAAAGAPDTPEGP
jgi:hypothetical protein